MSKRVIRRAKYPWSYYDDPDIRDSSNELHKKNVQRVYYALFPDNEKDAFRPYLFEKQETGRDVQRFLEEGLSELGKPFSLDTKSNLIRSLSKFLEGTPKFNASSYVFYAKLRDDIKARLSSKEKEPCPDFEELRAKLDEVVHNKKLVKGFRMLCVLPLHGIGAFRPSDLIGSRFQETDEYSFMDLENRVWHIREEQTKNGRARSVPLTPELVRDILAIYDGDIRTAKSCCVDKQGEPYTETESLGNMMKSRIGTSFNKLRSAFVSCLHRDEDIDIEEIVTMAKRMGHSVNTAIKEYNRNK